MLLFIVYIFLGGQSLSVILMLCILSFPGTPDLHLLSHYRSSEITYASETESGFCKGCEEQTWALTFA